MQQSMHQAFYWHHNDTCRHVEDEVAHRDGNLDRYRYWHGWQATALPEYGPNCRKLTEAEKAKLEQAEKAAAVRKPCPVRQQPLHDAHCAAWFARIVDSEFPMLDSVSYTATDKTQHAEPVSRIFREHPLVTGEPVAEDDSGGHAADCAGMPPAGYPRDVSITVVHSHRTLSKAARQRQLDLRASFCIREVIEARLSDKQQRPKGGRPSRETMKARAALGM